MSGGESGGRVIAQRIFSTHSRLAGHTAPVERYAEERRLRCAVHKAQTASHAPIGLLLPREWKESLL